MCKRMFTFELIASLDLSQNYLSHAPVFQRTVIAVYINTSDAINQSATDNHFLPMSNQSLLILAGLSGE